MKKVSIKAIALGMLAVFMADILAGVMLWSLLGPYSSANTNHGYFLLGSLILGTAATLLGGYLAARIAGKIPGKASYLNAGIIGGMGFVLGLFGISRYPLWFNLACLISVIPAALCGGYLALSKSRTSSE